MKRFGLLCIFVVAHGCAVARPPEAGSQTHFLRTCDSSCAAPYQCLCGLCSLPCSDEADCGSVLETAMCLESSIGWRGACEDAPRMCDVSCTANDDCGTLGKGFACTDGRCRAISWIPVDAPMSEPGSLAELLCNGSDENQLLLGSYAGFGPGSWSSHGAFAMLDGHCHYYVEGNYMNGIREGVLTADQADQLAREVGVTRLQGWTQSSSNCIDGGSTLIATRDAAMSCECGACVGNEAASKTAAIESADAWMKRLFEQGTPLSGPLEAAAVESAFAGMIYEPLTWPLTRALTTIDGLVLRSRPLGGEPGARFDDETDVAALRSLRQGAILQPSANYIAVQDEGVKYELFLRDELPSDVEEALTRFEADAAFLAR